VSTSIDDLSDDDILADSDPTESKDSFKDVETEAIEMKDIGKSKVDETKFGL
jgi:hypothetical protein